MHDARFLHGDNSLCGTPSHCDIPLWEIMSPVTSPISDGSPQQYVLLSADRTAHCQGALALTVLRSRTSTAIPLQLDVKPNDNNTKLKSV